MSQFTNTGFITVYWEGYWEGLWAGYWEGYWERYWTGYWVGYLAGYWKGLITVTVVQEFSLLKVKAWQKSGEIAEFLKFKIVFGNTVGQ